MLQQALAQAGTGNDGVAATLEGESFTLFVKETSEWVLETNTQERRITASVGFLVTVVKACAAFTELYQVYAEAVLQGENLLVLTPSSHPRLVRELQDLFHLLKNAPHLQPGQALGLPPGSVLNDLTPLQEGLFRWAMTWAVYHEVAHLKCRHALTETAAAVAEEREADRQATLWLFADETGATEREGRLQGMVAALLLLVWKELFLPDRSGFYPDPIERLHKAVATAGAGEDSAPLALARVVLDLAKAMLALDAGEREGSFEQLLADASIAVARRMADCRGEQCSLSA